MNGNFDGESFASGDGNFDVDEVPTGGGGYVGDLRHLRAQFRGVEDEADKLARRIREGTISAPVETIPPAEVVDRYHTESAKLAQGIAQARQEVAKFRAEIDRLEAAQVKRQTAKMQRELLLAQQAHQLAEVRAAVFLEEMEVLDVAFVATAILSVVLQ